MPSLIRSLLLLAGAAIVAVVVYHQFFQSSSDKAWETLGAATVAQSVQALENARDQIPSGPARPWADYELAMRLYDAGGKDNFDRAKQVAESAVADHPEHPTTPWLRRLIAAVATYEQAGSAQ